MDRKLFLMFQINFIKSLYYSLRFNGQFLIGYGTKINIRKGASIEDNCVIGVVLW